MSVYVDDMKAKFGRMIMCHMAADTEQELHAMADKIGVARKWYQGDHYDVCLAMRAKAVEFGAKEITWMQLGCKARAADCRKMVAIMEARGELGKAEEYRRDVERYEARSKRA